MQPGLITLHLWQSPHRNNNYVDCESQPSSVIIIHLHIIQQYKLQHFSVSKKRNVHISVKMIPQSRLDSSHDRGWVHSVSQIIITIQGSKSYSQKKHIKLSVLNVM